MTQTTNPLVALSWSGGKDSMLALHALQGSHQVVELFTVSSASTQRVTMHGVSDALIQAQAHALGIPLVIDHLPASQTGDQFETLLSQRGASYTSRGITNIGFGDIFLEDLKAYRESILREHAPTGIYPLWHRDTADLAHRFISLGFKATVTFVDERRLSKQYVGREYSEEFLSSLPRSVDPCGENGEFHTFVYDGPLFTKPVSIRKGHVVHKKNRGYFQELLLV